MWWILKLNLQIHKTYFLDADEDMRMKNIKLQTKPMNSINIHYVPQYARQKVPVFNDIYENEAHETQEISIPKQRNFVNTGDYCLSLWQPWASLIIYGIKRVEGRPWYSDLRGKLWIASTVKAAEPEVVQMVEHEYKLSSVGHLPFPDSYPTSVLLGCVDVVDVVTQEIYTRKYSEYNEENGSRYLFICKNPRKVKTPFRISGSHKLWKLEESELAQAQANLEV